MLLVYSVPLLVEVLRRTSSSPLTRLPYPLVSRFTQVRAW